MKEDNLKNEKKAISKAINSLRENIGLITAVIVFLGGILQFVSLLRIGYPYLRFFSISQLIIDGLIISILLPFYIYIPFKVYVYGNSHISKTDYWNSKKGKIINYLFGVILIYGLIIYIIISIKVIANEIMIKPIHLIWCFIFFCLIPYNWHVYFKNFPKYKNKVYDFLSSIYGFIVRSVLLVGGIFIFLLFTSILGIVIKPKDFSNFNYLEEKLRLDYGIRKREYKIAYFNDKYLFVKNYQKTSGKTSKKGYDILVLDIDYILSPPPKSTIKRWESEPNATDKIIDNVRNEGGKIYDMTSDNY